MKTKKTKQLNNKFDLEKMKVAKLKNAHLINGGFGLMFDDPATVTDKVGQASSRQCNVQN
jgi:hypothetical protein